MALFPNGPLVRAPRPSSTRRYGLFDVVQPETPADIHWQVGGVNWEDFLCTDVESFVDVCDPATGFVKPADRTQSFCSADPFQVIGSFDCSTGGRNYSSGEAFEIARQRLLQWEEHDVERALWTGLHANGTSNPSLAFGNEECDIEPIDLTPGASPINPVDAIALLEDALADTVPGGIIHVPHILAAYLANFMLLQTEGNRAYTPAGNSYVIGAGYPGTGPTNIPISAGETWIFATGPVGVWRSDVFMVPDTLAQSIDRSVNDITVRAERYYAVGYSCAVFAVLVDLTCACD